MAIVIRNTQQVREYAQQLATNAEKIRSSKGSIDYILSELAQYWEQTQQDAQKFSTRLKENSETIGTIIECNQEFARALENYIDATEATAQNTVGGAS